MGSGSSWGLMSSNPSNPEKASRVLLGLLHKRRRRGARERFGCDQFTCAREQNWPIILRLPECFQCPLATVSHWCISGNIRSQHYLELPRGSPVCSALAVCYPSEPPQLSYELGFIITSPVREVKEMCSGAAGRPRPPRKWLSQDLKPKQSDFQARPLNKHSQLL